MKTTLLALFAIFITIISAHAELVSSPAQPTGGFVGPRAPSMAPITIKQALSMKDDSIVVLTGKIVNSLGDEKYTFQDSTGQITIEIDDEDWHGIKVTPENTLEIVGELDKELFEQPKIDVKSFSIKQ